jgi:hypothetical protein
LGKGQWFAVEFMGKLLKRENNHSVRFAKNFVEKFLRRILWWTPSRSGVFENQSPAIIERDFGSFPC